MDFDPSFLDAIKGFEGFTPQAQWDFKQYTNGYGTRAGSPGETIDQATAEQRLSDELTKAAGSVDAMGVKNMPAGARNALISLTYNSGPAWMQAGLGDLVRNGDWNGAAERLQEYNKAGGQFNQGLANRRAVEASWMTGGAAPDANGPFGANTIARAKPASMPMFAAAPNQSQLPGAASAGSPAAGAGGGSDELSSLIAAGPSQGVPLLPAFHPMARVAALMAQMRRRG